MKGLAMSIIFGIRKPSGAIVSEPELLHLSERTARYAPDGLAVKTSGRVGMGFQPYYTNARSNLELAPATDQHGNLLTFDGRLDNYKELSSDLDLDPSTSNDSAIVLAAFLRWGEVCFSRFVGDWAVALWSKYDQCLYLARDHAGTRTMYFQREKGFLRWSTYYETFFNNGAAVSLDMNYAACYLSCRPVRNLTPYEGIQSVLPAHYVVIRDDKITRTSHWRWMPSEQIRYRSDSDYEEHFLSLFGQSIERRTGPGSPILAQLSGGIDSTSIVCMSDQLRRSHNPSAEILDTISFYDDSEPTLNETPYFSAVESQRGKIGTHIETSFLERTFQPPDPSEGNYPVPGADSSTIKRERKLNVAVCNRGYRVVLSGIGGDEVLGGISSGLPELAGYLISGKLNLLMRRSLDWCLIDRTPMFHQLLETIKLMLRLYRGPRLDERDIPPWIPNTLRNRCIQLAQDDVTAGRRFGLSPHNIDSGVAWWSVMETLPHLFPPVLSRPEYRYPYLDRDLVDYLFRIPVEQLMRPGRRRSLMRRALTGIVPTLVLERRQKAFIVRGPLHVLQHSRQRIDALFSNSLTNNIGIITLPEIRSALELTTKGREPRWWPALLRAINLELWLQSPKTYMRLPVSPQYCKNKFAMTSKQDPRTESLGST
jgi:asparagine synthase (glutamine-hydrolysing)